jgi:DNA (cytosine-5)-methyltransferase 1
MRGHLTSDSEFLLLRTPAFSDGAHSGPNQRDSSGHPSLSMQLLRTPAASEAECGHQPEDKARARGGQVTLSGQTNFAPDCFDRFEPAVRRWEEVTGMKAPNPTKPDGRDGAQRLSSAFTEWMMGLKPGWVTGHGLSRKDELKACGNGVVPQQAALALSMLLDDVVEGEY